MKPAKNISFLIESWSEEKSSAYLYRIIATLESNKIQTMFLQLGEEAEKQALMWEKEIKKAGGEVPSFRPDLRTRIASLLVRWFGARQIRSILAAMKVRGLSVYLEKEAPGHPMPKTIADVGRRHKAMGAGNNLRAAVFGVNDGMISNASLIMGLAGAHTSINTLILAGIAGLLAGAFSMSAGEYVSVRSQREMFEYQIDLEQKELELYPKEETAELALIYHARGLPKEEAFRTANAIMQNKQNALDTLAREELGINPEDLVSPYGAAFFSFFSFIIGAFIPLLPFLLIKNSQTLFVAIGLTALCLFIVGGTLSLYTGKSALKSGLRMLLIGAAAGAITYCIGELLGTSLGI